MENPESNIKDIHWIKEYKEFELSYIGYKRRKFRFKKLDDPTRGCKDCKYNSESRIPSCMELEIGGPLNKLGNLCSCLEIVRFLANTHRDSLYQSADFIIV